MTKVDAAQVLAEAAVEAGTAKVAVELDPKAVWEARFTEGLAWAAMRERFGLKYNSTRFYAVMAPYAKSARTKAVKESAENTPALARAIAKLV
jgi:hypothetical protein